MVVPAGKKTFPKVCEEIKTLVPTVFYHMVCMESKMNMLGGLLCGGVR